MSSFAAGLAQGPEASPAGEEPWGGLRPPLCKMLNQWMKRARWAGGGAAWALGGGGAAGNLELSLQPKEWFFLINSKCHFSHRLCLGRHGGCLRLALCSLILVTIEITDEMVAVEDVRSAIGGWVLRRQHACGVCSLPLTSRAESRDYAVWKMGVFRPPKCSNEAISSRMYCRVRALTSGLWDLGAIDYFAIKMVRPWKR